MRKKSVYILSELSERSIALALSIRTKNQKEAVDKIVISVPRIAEVPYHLLDICKQNKISICRKSIEILIRQHWQKYDSVTVILIDDNEYDNLLMAMRINDIGWDNRKLRVFAYCSSVESECLLDNVNIDNHSKSLHPMVLRRVNPIRNEVYRFLYSNSPYEYAHDIWGEQWINIVIAGLDLYGMEMLKALIWCCQMEGYFLRIDVFDDSPDSYERFAAECPGVIERGNQPRMGEDYYDLHFHPGIALNSQSFYNTLREIPEISWVFISSGNDADNIGLAQKIRSYIAGYRIDTGLMNNHLASSKPHPRIITVVNNDEIAQLIAHNRLQNHKGQYYHIDSIGNYASMYSIDSVLMSELETAALERHTEYGEESTFQKFEYFRRSSMASAIHLQYRQTLIKQDAELAAIVEHRRWCAYMRSTEGYTYGIIRDDLARKHPDLTAFNNLSLIDQKKDHAMNQIT